MTALDEDYMNELLEVDSRMDRLPQWAQRKVAQLQMRLRETRKDLSQVRGEATTEGWRVWLNPYTAERPLAPGGQYDTVRFLLNEDQAALFGPGPECYLDITIKGASDGSKYLEVRSSDSISVSPVASNVITVAIEDKWRR